MVNLAGQARATGLAYSVRAYPVLSAWVAVSVMLVASWLAGFSPNSDVDDQMKLLKVRQLLETGAWFDRTILGIAQPEPFVSHWLRIADLPYALLAWALAPLTGDDIALRIAAFAVPLLLLLAALALLRRIFGIFAFERRELVFVLATILAGRSLFEFSPERVDYHNVEMVLLLLSIVLTFERRPMAALANGAAVALALAISLEFAPFFVLIMAAHVLEFVRGGEDAGPRLRRFGLGLLASALAVYVVSEPPARYGAGVCDVYSAPHVIGLCLAGLTFALASAMAATASNLPWRTAAIVAPAAATLGLLVSLYPQCLGGPYAAMEAYVVDNWLHEIPQERSLFMRPEFVLSGSIVSAGIMFVGVLATLAYAASRGVRDRNVLIFALLSLLALALAIVNTRYLRYLPIFAAPGVLIVLASLSPGLRKPGAWLARPAGERLPPAVASIIPGMLLAFALVLFALVRPADTADEPAAELAGSCNLDHIVAYEWPAGARIMAPPSIGMAILAKGGGPAVTAVPFHTASPGIERVYRFLDPATANPRDYLDSSHATHVAVCAWRGRLPRAFTARYGLAAGLMGGIPPNWLAECPTDIASPLRIYSYSSGEAACPAAVR